MMIVLVYVSLIWILCCRSEQIEESCECLYILLAVFFYLLIRCLFDIKI